MRDHLGLFTLSSNLQFARGILLLDDASGTFNYVKTGTGADYTADYATVAAFAGAKGIHLATRTTTPAANDYVDIAKQIAYPESGLLVMRLKISAPDVSLCKTPSFTMKVHNGTQEYLFSIKWDSQAHKLYYLNSAGGWTEVPACAYELADAGWSTLELACDLLAMRYLHVIWGGTRVSLAGIAPNNSAANTTRGIAFNAQVLAQGAAVATMYLDSVYIGEYDQI